jgi:ribosomal protein L10
MKKLNSNTVRPKAITREGSIFEGVSCYVLDNGKRVITKRSMVSALSGTVKGEDANLARYIDNIPNNSALLTVKENIALQGWLF